MTIKLRADGNAKIGMGHITRTLSLGSYLADDNLVTLYTYFDSDFLRGIAKSLNIKVYILKDFIDEFISLINSNDIVIIDSYKINEDDCKRIKQQGVKVIQINDYYESKIKYSDFLINHSPGASRHDYAELRSSQLGLGFDFALLRKSFLREARKKVKKGNFKIRRNTLFISFGSSSNKNLIELYINQFKNLFEKIIIVRNPIETLDIQVDQNIEEYFNLSEKEMITLMKKADLLIVPCSTLLFESLAIGKPVLTGYFIENQLGIYNFFYNCYPSITIGNLSDQNELTNFNLKVLDNYPSEVINLIDGKSQVRISKIVEQWGL